MKAAVDGGGDALFFLFRENVPPAPLPERVDALAIADPPSLPGPLLSVRS